MGVESWWRKRRGALASGAAIVVATLGFGALAFAADGVPAAEVELNDGGVWITKQSALLVGHVNRASALVDGGVWTAADSFDVLQAGETVITVSPGSMTEIDPVEVVLGSPVALPDSAVVTLGGETVAIQERSSGRVWVLPADRLASFSATADPTLLVGSGGAVTVGRDGTVFAASRVDATVTAVRVTQAGSIAVGQPEQVPALSDDAQLAITAVGETAVVLDQHSGRLFTADAELGTVADPARAQVQMPSDAHDSVLVADPNGLITAPLDGGAWTRNDVSAPGAAVAPVWMSGCAYGAWNGTRTFLRDCVGEDADLDVPLTDVADDALLVFRVNRDAVMLNDAIAGIGWIADGDLARVENWNELTPPKEDSDEVDENASEESLESSPADRGATNTPPVANDDTFGVRAGRSTVLPVLENDSDADGDILTVSVAEDALAAGTLTPVQDGAAVQVELPAAATGALSFPYTVSDGRGGTDTATVTLTVSPETTNAAPAETGRRIVVPVEVGATTIYNLLPDWRDPDGDDVFLQSATATDDNDVTFAPDGRVTFRATAGTTGRSEVAVTVSDGQLSSSGTLVFDVREPGATSPVTNPDHVVVRAGQWASVSPLTNDTAGSLEPLRLTRVGDGGDAEIVPDLQNKTFAFRSSVVGTVYVSYAASAGPTTAEGVVRVDVLPETAADSPPVAVRDTALLPVGKQTLVSVLANDVDPSGGVLVVQSVDVPDGVGVTVAVVGNELLRIADTTSLTSQVRITYQVSNGIRSATGDVIIIPVDAPDQQRPPVVVNDVASVRVGDVVTVPVLANDYAPAGGTLTLADTLVEAPAVGEMFVAGDTVRYRAGAEPGTASGVYEVTDEHGQRVSGTLTVNVLPVDEVNNAAPQPRDLTARTMSGVRVRIPVPLDGIDPDGDSVEFLGLDSAPGKGIVTAQSSTWVEYEAGPTSVGLDTFTYRVRDRLGREATGTIRVGIAPQQAVNQAPFAAPDVVVVGPGRTVSVGVTANDTDPDGDSIALLTDGLVVPQIPGLTAWVEDGVLFITTPEEPVQTALQYTIVDGRGATAIGSVQLAVDADVPLLAPVAADDWVRLEDIGADGSAVVDVLANDSDPDGTSSALTVALDDTAATLTGAGLVQVQTAPERQLIGYTVTDEDGKSARAFIFVPSVAEMRPTLLTAAGAITVASGQNVQIRLVDHVLTAPGRTPIITEAARVSVLHGDGSPLVVDENTLSYTSAADYAGPDAITFQVTDGTSASDPDGRTATLTIPITVTSTQNAPPVFASSQITVGQGEPATTISLRTLTRDDDPGDLERIRYSIAENTLSGAHAELQGDSLQISAPADAPVGAAGAIRISVDDTVSTPAQGTIEVNVARSALPLAVAVDDVIADGVAGRPVTIPVTQNDVNPFPGTPLRLVGVEVTGGNGTAVQAGDAVVVTPAADWTGVLTARYRIQDASGDSARAVDGNISVTVRGRPDPPSRPLVESVQSGAVTLSWTAPSPNGALITGYTVTADNGGPTQACTSTTCTITGLRNGDAYSFTVTATNEVGTSDPSAPSVIARPDDRPGTPAAPIATAGDGEVSVQWSEPTNSGSAITGYTVEIVPAPAGGGSSRTTTATSMTWPGLSNGTGYQFRVIAHNSSPVASDPSAYSVAAVPSGVPRAPGQPGVSRLDPVGSRVQVAVSWTAADANGATISAYEVVGFRGSTEIARIQASADARSQTIEIPTSTTGYTFQVRAQNGRGWGPLSEASAPLRATLPPGAPDNVSLEPRDGFVTIASWTPAAPNGANPSELSYEYSANNGPWLPIASDRAVPASNGTEVTVRLRAVATVSGSAVAGAPSPPSGIAIPFGTPPAPAVTATQRATSLGLSWVTNTNGRPLDRLEYVITRTGGVHQGSLAIGTTSMDVTGISPGDSVNVRMWVVDVLGTKGFESDFTVTWDPPPNAGLPSDAITVSKGGHGRDALDRHGEYVRVSWTNIPTGTWTLRCYERASDGTSVEIGSQPLDASAASGSTTSTCVAREMGQFVWATVEFAPGVLFTTHWRPW